MKGPWRTLLFVPASSPRLVAKAKTLRVDAIVLDLEDAVEDGQKDVARAAALAALADGGFAAGKVGLRLNAASSSAFTADLAAARESSADFLVAPKVETQEDIAPLCAAKPAFAMIETPAGAENLRAIAEAPGLTGLMVGVNDLTKALRLGPATARQVLAPLLLQVVIAARARGLIALDGVYNRLDDPDGLMAEAEVARAFGFDGKTLIHPAQIDPALRGLRPSEAEFDAARRIVAAFQAPEAAGLGAIKLDGRMVERLHADQAQALLAAWSGV